MGKDTKYHGKVKAKSMHFSLKGIPEVTCMLWHEE